MVGNMTMLMKMMNMKVSITLMVKESAVELEGVLVDFDQHGLLIKSTGRFESVVYVKHSDYITIEACKQDNEEKYVDKFEEKE